MVKVFSNILCTLICVACWVFMIAVLFICIFTPHKTKYGHFTDPYKYWTNEAYVCQNFDANCNKLEK